IFLSFILSVFFMTLLISFGIGVEKDFTVGDDNTRLTFFGNNSNSLGEYLSVAIVLIVYLVIHNRKYFGKVSYLLLLFIPIFLNFVGFTGSRGAIVIILACLLLLFFTIRTTFSQKAVVLIGGLIFLTYTI